MKIRALLLSAFAFVAAVCPARADGFIVINRPALVPGISFAPLEVSFHHVDAKINGQVCTTTVDEEFFNPNNQQIEGTYLFPVPKGAQVDKFTMEINGKETEAEMLAADKARAIYEEIVRRERDPALLEYAGQDAFRVHVYPIEPHSRKHVKLSYTEVLKADSGLVRYTYPLNTEKFSAAPVHDVSVHVAIDSNRPITSIYSPTHDTEIIRHDPGHATVGFEAKEVRPDTDFQLFFAPQKEDVSVDLLTQRAGSDDGYFLLLASPGMKAKAKHLPKDVVFVLDTSGSMADDNKLVQAKKALRFCLSNLNADDRFEIVRFSDEAEQLFGKLQSASDSNVADAQKFVDKLKPIGGTAIFDALHQAMGLRPEKSDRPYVMVFITDGQPTVGQTNIDAIVDETKGATDAGTRIFCFGLGTDVNAHLLDRIAEQTHAVSDYVLPSEDLEVKVSNFFAKIREPVLANVKLTFPDGVKVAKMYPQQMPDLFQGDQLVLCGRYSGQGSGDLIIEGDAGGEHQTFKVPVKFPEASDSQPFVPRLWASRRVAFLLDEIRLHGENMELKSEVTGLAREFGLVTPYTAYLIMEDEQGRHVAEENQVMKTMANDREAKDIVNGSFLSFRKESSGASAIHAARAQNALKAATSPSASVATANTEAASGLSVSMDDLQQNLVPSKAFGGSVNSTVQAPALRANVRVMQYTQQSKYVGGRAFFQNDKQWVDSNVSVKNEGKSVRLKFGSDEYFALLAKHPEARAWLALGQNIKVLLDSTVYDIYGD